MSVSLAARSALAEPFDVAWRELRDVNDETPREFADAKWKIVCFLGTECPIAQFYGPRLGRLQAEFQADGLRVIGVISNLQDSVEDIRQYAAKHELSYPLIKDERQALARQFGATRTPEVFLLDDSGAARYQGRIDDQYTPGIARDKPITRHLREAIEASLAGQPVSFARTEAVGCLITFAKEPLVPSDPAARVTFTRDVAPLLNKHCVECHRPGEIGPFSLVEYDEVVGWGEMMLEVVEQKRMPPWHADPRFGKFLGARHMPQAAQETLNAWVQQGMPRGDPQDLPPAPQWTDGWHLPAPPDEVLPMREEPFVVPAEGTVEYQYFVIDPQWKDDRWVRAAQVVPGNAAVVHHAIVFVRPPDGANTTGIGWLGGYVPGQRVGALPTGHARRVPAGSKLVFQMHYTPNGRATEDVTRLGVWFSDADNVTHEVTTRVAIDQHFEIPPRARDHAVKLRLGGFARQSRLLGAMPHMHLRGKSFRLELERRGSKQGDAETLLSVPRYDFNWQHWYQLETPLPLGDIASLRMEARFDNSAANPANPAPDAFVTWGDQTWEEMAVAFFDIAHPRDTPRIVDRQAADDPSDQAARARRIRQETDKFLSQLDRNGDGVIVPDETPDTFRRFGFRKIDHNRDGRIERSEIESAAARRF